MAAARMLKKLSGSEMLGVSGRRLNKCERGKKRKTLDAELPATESNSECGISIEFCQATWLGKPTVFCFFIILFNFSTHTHFGLTWETFTNSGIYCEWYTNQRRFDFDRARRQRGRNWASLRLKSLRAMKKPSFARNQGVKWSLIARALRACRSPQCQNAVNFRQPIPIIGWG